MVVQSRSFQKKCLGKGNSKRGNKDIMEWLHDVGEIQPVIIDLALSFQL